MRYYGARGPEDRPNGMAFYGTNGAIFADRIGYEIYPDNDRIAARQMNTADATKQHAQYFVECIRSGTPSRADIETGHRSTTVPHLGNIAYRVGQKLQWDAEREDFVGAPEASKLLWREPRRPWDFVKKPA